MTQKMWNPDFFSQDETEKREAMRLDTQLKQGSPINVLPDTSGLIQTDGPTPRISFRPAPGQKIIKNRNSYIVFGKDRPTNLPSGYGGKGALGCDTIDIVVGRMSSIPSVNTRKRATIIDNHFGADAARIYISQLTDIDTNFGIADGIAGNAKARSGIGIKADVVRLVGREGIKIVTGKAPFPGFGFSGERNALGGLIRQPAPKIELIAGNNSGSEEVEGGIFMLREKVDNLQPIIKGANMVAALKDLQSMLENMMASIFNLAVVSTAFASVVSVSPFPHHSVAGSMTATQLLDTVVNNIWQQRINSNLWEANYCYPFGYRYVCSRSVYAT